MSHKNQSIIYVNFAPYENAGRILDYILEQFGTVVVFTFNFHKLTKRQDPSMLTAYRNGKSVYRTRLYQIPTPQPLGFLLLPIRSAVIAIQLLFHSYRLRPIYGPFTYFFTVNAFTAWCGNILRRLHLVEKTVFWVWDYYPPKHPDRIVRFMRSLYWRFDKPASLESDRVVFLNRRLEMLRKTIGIIPKDATYPVVEIGTDMSGHIHAATNKSIRLAFLGVLKKSQGLDLFFEAWSRLRTAFPGISLDVIGGGPDEKYYRARASTLNAKVRFHGYIPDEREVDRILAHCTIGIAPYLKEKSNVSYYSDPSKIKRYLSIGLPVVTTDVFSFSETIAKEKCGVIIKPDPESLIRAIAHISGNSDTFRMNVRRVSRRYDYRRIYRTFFSP